jgi:hypothetical protein
LNKLNKQELLTPAPNNPHAISALERQYETILGEIQKLEEAEYEWVGVSGFEQAEKYFHNKMYELHNSKAAIEKSIKLFAPRWDRSKIAPKKRQETSRLFDSPTTFQSAVWRAMRKSGKALKVAEIVSEVAADLGQKINISDQRRRLRNMTNAILSAYRKKGLVAATGSPARWYMIESVNHAARGLDSDLIN